MRRILFLAVVAVALLCCVVGTAVAGMADYCLIPPYVKTDVQPNILIIMDNSKVMGGPIFTWNDTFAATDPYVNAFTECPGDPDPLNRMALAYDPTIEYKGLFNSKVWYSYSSNQFVPDRNGVFDGNLLNFLTTSQYDLMMGILVGGKSTSRQTNINTLLGYNASVYPSCGNGTAVVPWDTRVFVYHGTDGQTYACEFKINNNNRGDLTISDSATYYTLSGYVCGLIKSSPVRPATNYFFPKISSVDRLDFQSYAQDSNGRIRNVSFLKHVFSFINGIFDLVASPADAAALKVANPNSGAKFSTTLYQAMTSYQCTASGGTGTYSWSATGLPSGISINSSTGLISGTPTSENDTTRGNIPVSITVSDGTSTASQSVSFTVAGSALTITAPTTTSNLTDANRGVLYKYQCTASGGHAGFYSWSASGLPSGLSINPSTGLISGTTTAAAGTYSVTISLNDGYVTKSVTVSLNLKETLAIIAPTASLPNAYLNLAYSYACQVQGGTGSYSWTISSGALPAGLSIDPSTGIISGTPTQLGTFSVTITVTSGGFSTSKTTTLVVGGVHITWPTDYFMIGDTIYGQPYTSRFRAVAAGGTGPYTWSATGLPAGLSIDPSQGFIYGTETTFSDFFFTAIISVTDGVTSDSVHIQGYNWEPSGSLYQMVNLSNGQYITGGIIGQQYGGFSVGTYYGDGQNNWNITGLPAGLNYYPYSGLIYGTPAGPAGCSSVTINTTNNSGSKNDSRTVNLCISDPAAPMITTPAIDSSYLPNATVGTYYNFTPVATGGTTPYTWAAPAGLPDGLSIDPSIGAISGTPTTGGTYPLTIRVTDNTLQQANRNVYLTVISSSGPVITAPTTGSTLPGATQGVGYAGYQCTARGGTGPYTWTAPTLPAGLSICSSTDSSTCDVGGLISGTPSATGTSSVTITVTDSLGKSVSVVVSITVGELTFQPNTKSFNVNICASYKSDPYNENCNTSAVNNCSSDADCPGERTGECNNHKCELKEGILQTYWNRARFGVIQFNQSLDPTVDECLPSTNQASFFTSVENALPVGGVTRLVNAEYMGVHTYMGDLTGSNQCDPFAGDEDQCRQNFVLVLTNGYGANNPPTPGGGTPNVFSSSSTPALPGTCQSLPYNMSKNACYGYNTDLRADKDGTQKVATYVVNSMGVNSNILQNAALNSGGSFYESTDANELQAKIEEALDDIIKRAAAGTAASVLASGEGSGANLVQAVFYPRRKFINSQTGVDDIIAWVGRLTNFWYYVDPFFANATIREDNGDRVLDLQTPSDPSTPGDYITQFYYDTSAEQTKAIRWGDTNGDGVADTGAFPDIPFENVGNLWEAGLELWKRDIRSGHDPRTIYTTVDDTNRISFSTTNAATLQPYLQAASSDEASKIISWVKGFDKFCVGTATPCTQDSDCTSPATCTDMPYRSRTVKVDLNGDGDTLDTSVGGYNETVARVWKLGDVLNSTPKISSWIQLNAYDKVYGDGSYAAYLATDSTTTADYKDRGMVFAGANDGMLHAFKLGSLVLNWSGQTTTQKAELTGSNLGREVWAFIPKQVLPYLQYLADINYGTCHLYSVDLSPYVFDASVASPSGCSGDYWNCNRTVDSWRTILIGGMRFGGACRNEGAACTDCVKTPMMDPVDTGKGLGYSSYFALDVTDQNNPQLLWEFSTSTLGFTTSGPAIVRINAKDFSSGTGVDVRGKNGRWFVVLGSGPTGPIDTPSRQFMGRSDQDLRLFIFDLMKGPTTGNYWEVDTGIPNAFAGSMLNATMDVDLDYQDDAVYIPYVKKASDGTWTDGGVGRLLTNSQLTGANEAATALNPSHWVWGKVMDGIGPVTSSVVRLEKQDKSVLWVYFGTGRYYYEKSDSIDDATGQRRLFGVKDPCFSNGSFAPACLDSDATNDNPLAVSALTDVTDVANVPSNPDASGYKGWYVNLDPVINPDTSLCSGGMYGYPEGNPASVVCRNYMAERVITDPLATSSGLVFFTTYKPYADICSLGGKSFIWALKYDDGGTPGAMLKGKALVQVSTGSIEQLDLSAAFSGAGSAGGRKSSALEGVPPTAQGLSIIVGPPPVKRVIHMRER